MKNNKKNKPQQGLNVGNLKGTVNKNIAGMQTNKRKVRPTGIFTGKVQQGKNLITYTPIPRYLRDPGSGYGKLLRRYHNELISYFKSIFNPELAVSGEHIAKQPSFCAIPTSNVTFKEQIYFNTSATGEFNMIWVPNFFATDDSLRLAWPTSSSQPYTGYSHLYFCTDAHPSTHKNSWRAHTSYSPAIALAKYRLVSAKLCVEYNGPLIGKGGSLQSCAVYDDLPVITFDMSQRLEDINITQAMSQTPVPDELDNYIDIELVRNGLWNRYVNVSETRNNKIECLAVPTDPTDQTFYPMGHYYSIEPSIKVTTTASSGGINYMYGTSSDGGHLSFVIKGTGMLSNNQPVPLIATVYYNFEVIANQSTAPFLRARVSSGEWKSILQYAYNKVVELVAAKNKSGDFKVTPEVIKDLLPQIELPNGITMIYDKDGEL